VVDVERPAQVVRLSEEETETPGFRKDNFTTRQSAPTATPRWRVSLSLETHADPSAKTNAWRSQVTRTSLTHRA
jgi:hypothetical protein